MTLSTLERTDRHLGKKTGRMLYATAATRSQWWTSTRTGDNSIIHAITAWGNNGSAEWIVVIRGKLSVWVKLHQGNRKTVLAGD